VCGFGGDVFDLRAIAQNRPVGDVLREADPDARRPAQRPAERVFEELSDLRLAVARGGQIEAEHGYINLDTGQTDLLVFRLKTPEGKVFRQCHQTAGGWVMRAPAKPWPLFHRAEIREADEIVIAEGEKCVEGLASIGIVATTSPAGAGKAAYADWTPLAGKHVWLWPDQDAPGRVHMKQVAAILDRLDPASTVRFIEPNDLDLGPKEDAFDFIEQCKVAGVDLQEAVLDVMARAKSLSLSSGLRDRIGR